MSTAAFILAVLIVAVGFLALLWAMLILASRADDEIDRLLDDRIDEMRAAVDALGCNLGTTLTPPIQDMASALAELECREARTHRVFVDGLEMPVRRGGGR
jgi:hypothetical protein